MSSRDLLDAALTAAARGWCVFPLVPGRKTPAIRSWEDHATSDPVAVHRFWAPAARYNVGVATGRSGLVVVDLDDDLVRDSPHESSGKRHGLDTFAALASGVGAVFPDDTFAVATPSGLHLYFRAPAGFGLRNTAGRLGRLIDTRAHGGYVVAPGSIVGGRRYRILRDTQVMALPQWLAHRLMPAPPPTATPPMQLPSTRADAYLRAILDGESRKVARAQVGSRHDALLRAAVTLGRLVAAGELAESMAHAVLEHASAQHLGVADYAEKEVRRTIDDGIAYGKQFPRRIRNL
ncbi:bifunctional DNA primase/polymerase [Nocardia vinacea]|uniref:bifunctional DNA primase/polymerase n=1 Tax=Nocardia vinacea TaxID=96468 RepID=UPI002E124F44|nr:bifunctional DNA primase/polymerase [Nocardia vinacea]